MEKRYGYMHLYALYAFFSFYVQECDVYGECLCNLENLELKSAFFSNATKNKHDKDCGTSFDVAILIKNTLKHILILEN